MLLNILTAFLAVLLFLGLHLYLQVFGHCIWWNLSWQLPLAFSLSLVYPFSWKIENNFEDNSYYTRYKQIKTRNILKMISQKDLILQYICNMYEQHCQQNCESKRIFNFRKYKYMVFTVLFLNSKIQYRKISSVP